MDLTTRVSLVQNLLTTKEIPASIGTKLLDINRTSIYYKRSPISDEELACKAIIDRLHTDNPTWGARQMSVQLKNRGHHVGRRKARRFMNEMDIYPIYPKMNLSKRMQQAKVCPYLLCNAVIDAPNQASVENGKRNISIANIQKIADGLNISLSELFSAIDNYKEDSNDKLST